MTKPPAKILRAAQVLGIAVAALTAPGTARAIVALPCTTVSAATRPGPIAGGQAAIRLMPPAGAGSVDISELTFVDADAVERALEVENLADGSAFLRANAALDVGEYTLSYRPPCSNEAFDLPLTIIPATTEPTTLGELTVGYEAYCPGDTFDTSLGPVARDYPPPIHASIALSDEASQYLHFLALDFVDDQDGTWTSGVLPVGLLANPLLLTRASLCGGSSPPASPPLHTFTAAPRIVDGATLPTLTAAADVACLDCPNVPVPDPSGGSGASAGASGASGASGGMATGGTSTGEASGGSAKGGATPNEDHEGCAVTTRGSRGGSGWGLAWALAAAAAVRRGRRRATGAYH